MRKLKFVVNSSYVFSLQNCLGGTGDGDDDVFGDFEDLEAAEDPASDDEEAASPDEEGEEEEKKDGDEEEEKR